MRQAYYVGLVVVLGAASPLFAQTGEVVRFTESFGKDAQHQVSCQVDIVGTLPAPTGAKANAKPLQVTGKSIIKYDERFLQLASNGRVERTLRHYRQMEFQRKVGEEEQQNALRPEVRRLVILRHNQYEVPFCPTGPLTWGEIELVRTDVFVPALQGLFPTQPVRVGDRWRADNVAIQELTDLEKIDKTDFICTLEKITTFLGRRNAHVNFEGKVQGVGEDGNALHELRGSFYYDIEANFLSYVYVKGTHHLLNKDGVSTGKIEGTFVLTRSPGGDTKELSDEANRGLTLVPTADNSLLLFEQPKLGVRVVHPRNWRVAGTNDKQIGIDENRGAGLLVTLSPGASTPTGQQFYLETLGFLLKQQALIVREQKPRVVQPGLETFSFEGEVGKQKVVLQYFTIRQGNYGATIAARMTPTNVEAVQREVESIARGMQLSPPR